MTLKEFFSCTGWTLCVAAVVVPLALVLASGHAGISTSSALAWFVVLLPAFHAWRFVEPVAGGVLGAIAAIVTEFACIFVFVFLVRVLLRRKPNGRKAS